MPTAKRAAPKRPSMAELKRRSMAKKSVPKKAAKKKSVPKKKITNSQAMKALQDDINHRKNKLHKMKMGRKGNYA